MTAVDVTILDQTLPAGLKRTLAARLTAAVGTLDRTDWPGRPARWVVLAAAVPPAARASQSELPAADLDYAAWHAHLSGARRWVPGGEGDATA